MSLCYSHPKTIPPPLSPNFENSLQVENIGLISPPEDFADKDFPSMELDNDFDLSNVSFDEFWNDFFTKPSPPQEQINQIIQECLVPDFTPSFSTKRKSNTNDENEMEMVKRRKMDTTPSKSNQVCYF